MSAVHPALKLYRHPLSGHSHRVELLLSLLGLQYERIDVDLKAGEQRTGAFLKLNPFGQVPVLDDRGTVVTDSNAILVHLSMRHGGQHYLPDGPEEAVEAQRWFSVSSGPLITGPASARLATVFGQRIDRDRAIAIAGRLFEVFEQHIAGRAFLLGKRPTLPDVSVYSYTAHAPEGGISLGRSPAIRAWVARMEELDGFVPMATTRVGLLAT